MRRVFKLPQFPSSFVSPLVTTTLYYKFERYICMNKNKLIRPTFICVVAQHLSDWASSLKAHIHKIIIVIINLPQLVMISCHLNAAMVSQS